MKNRFLICVLLILLTGCAETHNSNISGQTMVNMDIPETETPEQTYENSADTEYPVTRTRLAVEWLDLNVKGHRYPNNYAGAYVIDETLMIMLTDDDRSQYGYMARYDDCIAFERAEHSMNELNELYGSGKLSNILKEHDIDWVMMGIDRGSNAVSIMVFDKYNSEKKAEIVSYFEEYPVIIEFIEQRIIPD